MKKYETKFNKIVRAELYLFGFFNFAGDIL